MKIKVESDTIWTINDLKEYLSDMHNDKYQEMDYDQRLELAACAYIYCRYPEIAPEQISYLCAQPEGESADAL